MLARFFTVSFPCITHSYTSIQTPFHFHNTLPLESQTFSPLSFKDNFPHAYFMVTSIINIILLNLCEKVLTKIESLNLTISGFIVTGPTRSRFIHTTSFYPTLSNVIPHIKPKIVIRCSSHVNFVHLKLFHFVAIFTNRSLRYNASFITFNELKNRQRLVFLSYVS